MDVVDGSMSADAFVVLEKRLTHDRGDAFHYGNDCASVVSLGSAIEVYTEGADLFSTLRLISERVADLEARSQ
jgi:hypothetical protein